MKEQLAYRITKCPEENYGALGIDNCCNKIVLCCIMLKQEYGAVSGGEREVIPDCQIILPASERENKCERAMVKRQNLDVGRDF